MYEHPWISMQIKYFEERPLKVSIQNYTMNGNNSFVISLLVDKKTDNSTGNLTRFKHFLDKNRGAKGKMALRMIQRHPAIRWQPSSIQSSSRNSTIRLKKDSILTMGQQQIWLKRFPYVKRAVQEHKYGDAGCFVSHMKLFYQLLDSAEPYYFIFEDDAKLDQRLFQGLAQTLYVQAPNDADIISLTKSATHRVRVPLADAPQENVIRVIAGYGGYGYVITKKGASILINHLSNSPQTLENPEPIDVVMMNSYRDSPRLRVYYSHRDAVEVHHRPDTNKTISIRKQINE